MLFVKEITGKSLKEEKKMQLALIRRYLWVVPVILGAVFIAAGAYMFSEGRAAKAEVRAALIAEQVTTPEDASIPSALVQDPATAQAQADIILAHSLKSSNGKTYAEMERTDPARATYLNGVTLRTALNLAVMGFKVSDLVMGLGAFVVVVGVTNVALLAPALFWLGAGVQEEARVGARKQARTQLPAPSGS